MTKYELAKELDGIQYEDGIPEHLVEEARKSGLVIVSAFSDDLIEFDGAIHDEGYVSDGDLVRFDRQGIIPDWDSLDKEVEQDVRDYFARKDVAKPSSINVHFNAGTYTWAYACSVPHHTFSILEGNNKYCLGLVFRLSDVAGF